MNVAIITEGNSKIGFGHITRCLSLYQAFEYNNITPLIIVNGDNNIQGILDNTNFIIFNWLKNKRKLFEIIRNYKIVIIDSYLADIDLFNNIAENTKIPVYFDDTIRIKYPRGIVLNGAIGAENLNYPDNRNITYLLGTKFQPIRKAFWNIPKKKTNNDVKQIMITFGGNDIRNIVPRILKMLTIKFPNIEKNVVIAKAYTNYYDIEREKDINTKFHFDLSDLEMKNLMLKSDIAISAAGQTLQELALTGTPTIAVAIADNQKNIIDGWIKNNFIEYAGTWKNNNLINNIQNSILQFNYEIRRQKKDIGKSLTTSKGSLNVVNEILNY